MTVEDNLQLGAFRASLARTRHANRSDRVYALFPR
jgi:ABC-type branched-subunit amino acid transport system ATPase component